MSLHKADLFLFTTMSIWGCKHADNTSCLKGIWTNDTLILNNGCLQMTQFEFREDGTGQKRNYFCPNSCTANWVYTQDFTFEENDGTLTLHQLNDLRCGEPRNLIFPAEVSDLVSCNENEMIYFLKTYDRIE